ncbi:MAG: glycosyltransferase family 2 protein [Thermoguttaceae bacterium]|nr:glycosyltransferase family 2 protein [Thermoguttaceae bacterium]
MVTPKPEISVVVPEYMGKTVLRALARRVHDALAPIAVSYELIFVNDASPDGAWDEIAALSRDDPAVVGVNLSRNFGQHYAITAGLTKARGDWVVVMDCDLQDVPEEIPKLYAKAREGFDVVLARRVNRQDSFVKRVQSKAFYALFGYLTDTKMDAATANFGIFRRKVIEAVLQMGDSIRCFPLMIRWVGFRQTAIPVVHAARPEGKSSYSLVKLLRLASDNIITFSNKPLKMMTLLGAGIAAVSVAVMAVYLVLALMGEIKVAGYASLILSIWFVCGALMTMLGVVGVYLGKVFNQTKGRPKFIISEVIGCEEE